MKTCLHLASAGNGQETSDLCVSRLLYIAECYNLCQWLHFLADTLSAQHRGDDAAQSVPSSSSKVVTDAVAASPILESGRSHGMYNIFFKPHILTPANWSRCSQQWQAIETRVCVCVARTMRRMRNIRLITRLVWSSNYCVQFVFNDLIANAALQHLWLASFNSKNQQRQRVVYATRQWHIICGSACAAQDNTTTQPQATN